jgi:hypothetical protein
MTQYPRWLCGLLLLAATPTSGAAQQAVLAQPDLPPAVALAAFAFHNSPETLRFTGETWIAPGSQVTGDVAVIGGPLHLEGHIAGNLLIVNGDLRVGRLGAVDGTTIVIGGTLTGAGAARLAERAQVYAEPLRFVRAEGGLIEPAPARRQPGLSAGLDLGGVARAEITLAARGAYNRVEGLPIAVGPRIRTLGANPLALDALLIYRTAPGLHADPDDLGWNVRLEQHAGGRQRLGFGVTFFSEIVPIERGGLLDREASLVAFVLHRDYRDHYERSGWSVFHRASRPQRPTQFVLEYRDERHATVPARSPWSLLRNNEPWRPQPVVAEGRLRVVAADLQHDTRNDPVAPSTGWFASVRLERGFSGDLRYPLAAADSVTVEFPAALPADPRFTSLLLDVRRYARLGPASRLAVRVYGGGAMHAGPLPPQRQLALGGEGSLPGYRLFRFDCGARLAPQLAGGDFYYPAYGCDRAALVQLEYHGAFPFARRLLAPLSPHLYVGDAFGWVLFFDAGRAWNDASERFGRTRGQDDFSADTGLGVRLGQVGVYWVLPLSGSARGINFFVRAGPRI